jgi:hypothetical protein
VILNSFGKANDKGYALSNNSSEAGTKEAVLNEELNLKITVATHSCRKLRIK